MISKSNRYVMTSLVSLSVWIISILINALLFVFIFAFSGSNDFWQDTGFVLLFSAVFSFPGISIFWLVFLIKCRNDNLFTILLITALCTSLLSVLVFFLYLAISFGADRGMSIFILPVLSALTAAALHRPAISDVVIVQNKILNSKDSESLEA